MKQRWIRFGGKIAPLALAAAVATIPAFAAPRGGFGGHSSGRSFSAPAGRGFSGGFSGGHAYAAPRVAPGYRGGGYIGPRYYGPGFGLGFGVGVYPYAYAPYGYPYDYAVPYDYAPYGYAAPAPYGYSAPNGYAPQQSCQGYYDQNGAWQPSPDCAAQAPGSQPAPAPAPPASTAPYGY